MSKSSSRRYDHRSVRLTRRNLLRALGAGSAVAPFVPLLEADAQASVPKRVVFLWSPNGVIDTDVWQPSGSETDFTLSEQLQPLERWKDQLTIVAGTGFTSDFNSTAERRAHVGNPSMILTGRPNLLPGGRNNPLATGISLDQYFAEQLSADTPYSSLHFSVYSHPIPAQYTISYSERGELTLPEDNPVAAFNRLFANVPSGSGATEDPHADQRSVLDLVRQELTAVERRIGARDRHKLEGHLDAIREIERSLERRASIQCEAPEQPTGNLTRAAAIPEASRIFLDVTVEALKCDLTRVITMQWSLWRAVMTWLGHSGTQHDSSHAGGTLMTESNQWVYEEMAYFMDRLAEIPEGGGTMLDHTLLVWFSEHERGQGHGARRLPFMLAGGGAHLPQPTGRFISVSGDRCHADVLTSLCQIVGLDDEVFGDPRFAQGALSELI